MEIIKTIRRRTKVTKTKAGYSVEGSVEITTPEEFQESDAVGEYSTPTVFNRGNHDIIEAQVDLMRRLEEAFPSTLPLPGA